MNSSTVSLIVSFIFVFFLIVGFLIGFWRGIRKSAVNFAFSIVGVILAFFITPLVTNALLTITVPYEETTITLNQYLIEMLKQNADICTMIENNANLAILIEKIPSAVANTIVFLVLTIILMLLFYIIYRIVASLFMKRNEEQKVYRVWGGALGVVKMIVVLIFMFMPLSSLIKTADDLTIQNEVFACEQTKTLTLNNDLEVIDEQNDNQQKEQNNQNVINQILPTEVKEIVSGLSQNFFFKICGAVGLDDAMFDYYGTIDIAGDKVSLRKEIISYADFYDVSMQIANIPKSEHTFAQLDFDKLEIYFNNVIDGNLFKQVVVEILQDAISNYQNYSFLKDNKLVQKYCELLDNVSQSLEKASEEGKNGVIEYFKDDLKSLFKIFKQFAQSGILDQISSLTNSTSEDIIKILANEKNQQAFASSLDELFSMNIIHDGIDVILNNVLPEIIDGVEEVVVDTSGYLQEQWQQLASELNIVLKNFSEVASQIDITQVINDPASLLSSENNIDIQTSMASLGNFIDSVLDVSILKNAEGESILTNLLTENNFILPTDVVYKNDGTEVTLTCYQEYLTFISQSLQQIKDSNLYSIISQTSDTTEIVKEIANIISDNQSLLQDIFLPLYQVEPTKTLITDKLISSVQSDLIDLSYLNNLDGQEGYNAWKQELGYVSQIIVSLNKTDDKGVSYLDYAISGDVDALLQNLGSNVTITEILTPILYANSTSAIKSEIFSVIKEVFDKLAQSDVTIQILDTTFVEGDSEDQTSEVCLIFEDFVSIFKQYKIAEEQFSFDNIDSILLGQLLDHIKENAYRVELKGKSNEGIFKNAFDKLYNNLIKTYPSIKDIIKDKQSYEISFANLMQAVVEISSADIDSFIGKVGEIIGSDSEITIEKIEDLVGSINSHTTQQELQTIDTVLGVLEDFDVNISVPGQSSEEIESNKAFIENKINSNEFISQTTKDKLNKLFGITIGENI